jgi:hypothetical protein
MAKAPNLSSDKFHWRQNSLSDRGGATADQTHLLGSYRPAVEPPSAILSQYRAHLELIRAFNEVEPGMRQREILPEGRGVLYRAGGTQVLWAFADFDHTLGAACKVRDVRRGQDAMLTVLPARRHGVYMIGGYAPFVGERSESTPPKETTP